MSIVMPRSRSAFSLSSTHAYLNEPYEQTGKVDQSAAARLPAAAALYWQRRLSCSRPCPSRLPPSRTSRWFSCRYHRTEQRDERSTEQHQRELSSRGRAAHSSRLLHCSVCLCRLSSDLVDEMAGRGGLAAVHVTDHHQIHVNLLLTHDDCSTTGSRATQRRQGTEE